MLLEDIIQLATDNKQSITVLLRKCVVLAHQLKNERLKAWANKELNGYADESDELPDYRITPAQARGHFNGPWGSAWSNVPIPPAILEEKHKKFAMEVHLTQAMSAYEDLVNSATPEGTITMQWPANLVLYYQQRIPNSKGMVLSSAYQEIPRPSLVELLDTIRNRVLNMALKIQAEVGSTDKDLKQLTPQDAKKLDQTIVNNIYGGNVYVAAGQANMNATTIQQQNISAGDWDHLKEVLRAAGLSKPELDELSDAVQQDGGKMGNKVMRWVRKTGPGVLSGGIKIGAAVGQTLLIEYLKQYFGLGLT